MKAHKDIYNGQLPPAEYVGFLFYLITHNLGKFCITFVIVSVIVWALLH